MLEITSCSGFTPNTVNLSLSERERAYTDAKSICDSAEHGFSCLYDSGINECLDAASIDPTLILEACDTESQTSCEKDSNSCKWDALNNKCFRIDCKDVQNHYQNRASVEDPIDYFKNVNLYMLAAYERFGVCEFSNSIKKLFLHQAH